MAEVTVRLRYLRQAPRKVRRVADLLRGQPVTVALDQLTMTRLASARPLAKLLHSAVAAATDHRLATEHLIIRQVRCDQGPALKRRQINARGRASQIKKYLTHVTLTVSDSERNAVRLRKVRRNNGTKD
ncbi:50S ribosomal protein L22 [Candidatus Berkelbacteria bacterium]|nr:50S ribosomal protein L22 [Candidatus Berkelbacteria bacterium]